MHSESGYSQGQAWQAGLADRRGRRVGAPYTAAPRGSLEGETSRELSWTHGGCLREVSQAVHGYTKGLAGFPSPFGASPPWLGIISATPQGMRQLRRCHSFP